MSVSGSWPWIFLILSCWSWLLHRNDVSCVCLRFVLHSCRCLQFSSNCQYADWHCCSSCIGSLIYKCFSIISSCFVGIIRFSIFIVFIASIVSILFISLWTYRFTLAFAVAFSFTVVHAHMHDSVITFHTNPGSANTFNSRVQIYYSMDFLSMARGVMCWRRHSRDIARLKD